ncbi:hypothetical protein NPIL_299971, partial [Nephila pilipes]
SSRTRPAKRAETRPWSGAGLRRSPSKYDAWKSARVQEFFKVQSSESLRVESFTYFTL